MMRREGKQKQKQNKKRETRITRVKQKRIKNYRRSQKKKRQIRNEHCRQIVYIHIYVFVKCILFDWFLGVGIVNHSLDYVGRKEGEEAMSFPVC